MNSKKTNTLLRQADKISTGCVKSLKNSKFYTIFLIAIVLIGGLTSMQAISTVVNERIIHSTGTILWISPLHVENGQFKDIFGNTIYLRGVLRDGFTTSCVGFWQPERGSPTSGYETWDENAVRVHLQQLKDLGMNVMRFLLIIEWWQKDMATSLDGRTTNRHYRECVKDTVRIAGEYGIYIILCWYAVKPGPQPKGPYPPYSNTGDEEIIPNRDAFVSFWVNFAQEMKGYSNVLYEVFNEPAGMEASEWFDTVQMVINGIRSIGDNHIILAQYGYCGGFVIQEFKRLSDPTGNIGYANHIYRWPPGATMSPPYDVPLYEYEDIKNHLTNYWNYDDAMANNITIIITELGPYVSPSWNQTQELTYYENILTILNDWKISYTANHWDNPWVPHLLQNFSGTVAPFPLNQYGQILVDKIARGKT